LYTGWSCEVFAFGLTNSLSSGCGLGHMISLNFCKIIDNNLEMMQDRDVITTED